MMMIKKLKAISPIKLLIWFGIVNLLIVSALIAYSFLHVEKPDAGREAFYASSQANIPDNQNIAIALTGLSAPAGADIVKHGRFVVDTLQKTPADDDAKKIIAAAGKLDFEGTSDELECWVPSTEAYADEKCASSERVKTILADNKELLSRYKSLYSMPSWQGTSGNGQYVININKLVSAEILIDLESDNADSAYTKWRDNHVFISHVLKQDGTMIERAIFLVVDGISLMSLENILFKSPEIGITHFEELNSLLKANRLERYNLKGMLRGDYMFIIDGMSKTRQNLDDVRSLNMDYIKNRFYRYQLDFLNRTQMPPSTFDSSVIEMQEKYKFGANIFKYDWLNPLQSVLANLLISGQLNGFSLVKSMHSKDALIKLLNLSIKIRQQKIPEAEIQSFLNNASSEYNSPFTNKPMQWDAIKKVIYYIEPSGEGRKVVVRL
jgi:hypothetical protein